MGDDVYIGGAWVLAHAADTLAYLSSMQGYNDLLVLAGEKEGSGTRKNAGANANAKTTIVNVKSAKGGPTGKR